MQWLRRSFIAGFFVTVPLFISVAALLWLFRLVDGFMSPFYVKYLGSALPGLGIATTALAIVIVGAVATNVVGKRLLQRAEWLLLHVPLFRSVYAPVKQLVVAFSPDNEHGFKRVVLIEDTAKGFVLGFLTREFTIDRGQGPEALVAVYVPTNHLYLGDVVVVPEADVIETDLTVEDGVSLILSVGASVPEAVAERRGDQAGVRGRPFPGEGRAEP